MKYNPDIHHRRSIRLKGFDYSSGNSYFITICTKNRENYFGTVGARHWLALNEFGEMVKEGIKTIPLIYSNVSLDEFVIMPNHLHAIIMINQLIKTGRADVSPLQKINSKTIGRIVGQFKSSMTKEMYTKGLHGFAWQRNYYEHIIRNTEELNKIREYIIRNPFNWDQDEYK
ncbi:MAG: transposase [Deltaproteobacteria bacterium]